MPIKEAVVLGSNANRCLIVATHRHDFACALPGAVQAILRLVEGKPLARLLINNANLKLCGATAATAAALHEVRLADDLLAGVTRLAREQGVPVVYDGLACRR